jgi:hypothetical protein
VFEGILCIQVLIIFDNNVKKDYNSVNLNELRRNKMNDIFTYEEFVQSMTLEQIQGWAYEGVRLSDLYKEYLALQEEPQSNYRPEWAY